MEPFSALLAICAGNSPVNGEFPAQMPVTRSFDIFFDLRLEQIMARLVIWDAIAPIMTSMWWDNWIEKINRCLFMFIDSGHETMVHTVYFTDLFQCINAGVESSTLLNQSGCNDRKSCASGWKSSISLLKKTINELRFPWTNSATFLPNLKRKIFCFITWTVLFWRTLLKNLKFSN